MGKWGSNSDCSHSREVSYSMYSDSRCCDKLEFSAWAWDPTRNLNDNRFGLSVFLFLCFIVYDFSQSA